MKKERLFRVIGMIEDDWIKEAEDEQIIQKKLFSVPAVWRWTAAAAGILLVIGTTIFYKSFDKNDNFTSILNGSNYIETIETTVAAGNNELEEAICDRSETAAEQIMTTAAYSSASGTEESAIELKESQEEAYNWDKKVILYAEVIEEIYQPYQGEVLYLNLENDINLEGEQKENLLEVLNTEYKITVISGNFEELCKQEMIDAEAEEIAGVYLSFQITAKEEDHFNFRVDCWRGKDLAFGWQDCYAWYQGDEWHYKLGGE